MSIDYAAMQKAWPRQKAALKRAQRITDRDQRQRAVERVCIDAVHEWNEIGAWPDDWALFQRGLDDARHWRQQIDLDTLVREHDTINGVARERILTALDSTSPMTMEQLAESISIESQFLDLERVVAEMHKTDVVFRYIDPDVDLDTWLVRHRWPQHRKMNAVSQGIDAVRGFIAWAEQAGYVLAGSDQTTDADEMYLPGHEHIENLVYRHFGIDRDLLEAERREMVDEIANANEERKN